MVPGLQIAANPQGEGKIPSLNESILRVCSNCSLSLVCPEFVAEASCAYKIPVSMRTIEELRAWASMLVELQMQRVMMLRMGEEMSGGAPDAALSAEVDRMSKLQLQVKELKLAHASGLHEVIDPRFSSLIERGRDRRGDLPEGRGRRRSWP
jgi:hypothetical protein